MITGSIQIKKDRYYLVYRTDAGKQKWKSTGIPVGSTKKEQRTNKDLAVQFKLSFFKELEKTEKKKVNEAKKEKQKPLSVTDYLSFWLKEIRQTIKPSTFEGYEKAVKTNIQPYFRNHYPDLMLTDLTALHVTQFLVFLANSGKKNHSGLSKKSVLNIRGVLSSALSFAADCRFIDSNPSDHARMPLTFGESEKPETTIYTKEQVIDLLDYAEKTNSKSLLFLYLTTCTGCRRGEIMGLTWENVDLKNGMINICLNRVGCSAETLKTLTTPKTKTSIRTLMLPVKVTQMLRDEKKRQDEMRAFLKDCWYEYPYDYVIRQEDGRIYNPSSMNRIVNRLMESAGLPHCRIHDIRHFVATILFEANVPVNQITAQLGHASTSITEHIYVHRTNANTGIASNTLANAIGC